MDRVVLRFDEVAREIRLGVKTGAFSSTPTAPSREKTATVNQLGLALVLINHGSTTIPQQDITDERLTDACGLVSSIIEIPVQEMWDAWNLALGGIETAWEDWFESVQNDLGVRVMIGETEPAEIQTGDLWLRVV